MTDTSLDTLCVNTIRTLAMDAVQQANSGHPGTPMAMAPVAYALWQWHMRFDPDDPIWPNRDRFVLSMGHASMLLYSLLHLTGVKAVNPEYETLGTPAVTLDDIRRFRQLDSKCPGHPEYHWTSGVETTTGPLGQGVATSVGMAIAGRWLAARYNRPDYPLFDYDVYALGGDGCMMEGISSEAASRAGHLRLANLCWIYDNNRITIEGRTDLAFTEDVASRFLAYGWNVVRVGDANDLDLLGKAFATFKACTDRPTLIIVDSHIGWGSPHKHDSSAAHGEPLGEDEIRLTKQAYGWPEDAKFLVPDAVPDHFRRGLGARGRQLRESWHTMLAGYRREHAALADELDRLQRRELPEGWDRELPTFEPDAKGLGGRDASAKVLNAVARAVPWLVGGSADLAPSTKTRLTFDGAGDLGPTTPGTRNAPATGVAQGAYVLADPPRGEPEVILIGTGSEVSLCMAAYEELTAEGVRARVVSMPSWELFERQPEPYRESVLPPSITARVAVEQASTFGWAAYVGSLGEVIGMKTFGASAPLKALQTKFGFTPERVVAAARETLARARARR